MSAQTQLSLLKADLDLMTTSKDEYLNHLLEAARAKIRREGITLKADAVDDDHLVAMYAAYLFRKRADGAAGMPRMLRYALNNRLFDQKTAVSESDTAQDEEAEDAV